MLAIDIDPTLVKRAQEQNAHTNITFESFDFTNSSKCKPYIWNYLKSKGASLFTITFCFSTTMWIHLNNGDDGLRRFLCDVHTISHMVVIEPQPWKCYKTAVRRMKLSNEKFPHYGMLKMRESVEMDIERTLLGFGSFRKVGEVAETKWNRKMLFFRR